MILCSTTGMAHLKVLYLAITIKRYFISYLTATCFDSFLWSHLQVQILKRYFIQLKMFCYVRYLVFTLAQQLPVGRGLLIHEVSRSHTRHTAIGRTPLDDWSARRRDLYLSTHNTHNRQTSMPRWDSNPQSLHASGRRPTP